MEREKGSIENIDQFPIFNDGGKKLNLKDYFNQL